MSNPNSVPSNLPKTLAVTLFKSLAKRLPKHLANIRGLGLTKINQTVYLEDTPAVRGMINQVFYLVKVEEVK